MVRCAKTVDDRLGDHEVDRLDLFEGQDVFFHLYFFLFGNLLLLLVNNLNIKVASLILVNEPNSLLVFFIESINWIQNYIPIVQSLAPDPWVLVAEHNLIKPFLFGNKSDFDHILTALNRLEREHLFQLCHRMKYKFILLALINQFIRTAIISSIETKLDIVCLRLKHDADHRPCLVHLDDSYEFLTRIDFLKFWNAYLHA